MSTIYEKLDSLPSDIESRLNYLVDYLTDARRSMELFEVLKMRSRYRLGLPLIASQDEPSRSESVEAALERGMVDACRVAGTMLLEDGKVAQGWMYLRPTGDLDLARRLLSNIEITPDNHEDMVGVLLNEGVDIGRGYTAVIERQGTCNAITTYQQAIVGRKKSDRTEAAAILLRHLYHELSQSVRDDICRRMAPAESGETLLEMIDARPELLAGGGYHLDTTHIASVVGAAVVVVDPDDLQKAYELTQYGRRLHHQFQYPGEEPFKDYYIAYGMLYSALLGRDVEAARDYFRTKAETLDPLEHGTAAIETYVDLLDRTGQPLTAIEAATSLVPEGVPPQRIVPMLLEIAGRVPEADQGNAYQTIANYCRQRSDLLGYTAALAGQISS